MESAGHGTAAERRHFPRIAILEQFHSQFVALDVPVLTCDVSYGGFSIKTPVAFPHGDVHEFLFTRNDGVSLLVTARAVHCQPTEGPEGTPVYLTGFEFVLEDARTRRAVEGLIASLRSAPDVL